LDLLFSALSQNAELRWNAKIIGDGDPQEKNALIKITRDLGIESKVEWIGWHTDPWAMLESATALVLPSMWEGFPMVLLEALSHGIPVIASDCLTGPSDIILNGENGWLFPVGNENALADLIRKIIQNEISLPSSRTCQDSIRKFSAEMVVSKMENALKHWHYHLSVNRQCKC